MQPLLLNLNKGPKLGASPRVYHPAKQFPRTLAATVFHFFEGTIVGSRLRRHDIVRLYPVQLVVPWYPWKSGK